MKKRLSSLFFGNFDYFLFIASFILACLGIMLIFSATRWTLHTHLFLRQILWLCMGMGIMLIVLRSNYRHLHAFSLPLYILGILLLIAVFFFGSRHLGAIRWLGLGPILFQPSEFVKIAFIIMLSHYFAPEKGERKINRFSHLIPPLGIALLPFLLIMAQPDLGTALILLFIFFSILYYAGTKKRYLLSLILAGMGIFPFIWRFLHDYQKARLLAFLHPEKDPLGAGYHLIQSRITIGSGEIWGKGFLQGTQTQLHFLPQQHTDFIFSVAGEEFGFLGSLLIISLYFFLLMRGIKIAGSTQDRFGQLLAIGIVSMFGFQMIINLGMSMGLAPVTGLPLPLLSYGGSSLISAMLAIGILLNIRLYRLLF